MWNIYQNATRTLEKQMETVEVFTINELVFQLDLMYWSTYQKPGAFGLCGLGKLKIISRDLPIVAISI